MTRSKGKKELLLGMGFVTSLGLLVVGGGFTNFLTPYLEVSEAVAYLSDHPDRQIEISGLIAEGSIQRSPNGLAAEFGLTDGERTLHVSYRGLIPDNFESGQQVVVTGTAAGRDSVRATRLLVKCPSRYESGTQKTG